MIETKSKNIGGREWTVTQFPGMEALRLKVSLVQTFGPALGALLAEGSGSLLDADLASINFAGVADALMNRLDEARAEALVLRLLRSTRIDGQEVTKASFDMTFVGDYAPNLYAGLKFVLEVNYGGFIAALATGLRQAPRQVTKG